MLIANQDPDSVPDEMYSDKVSRAPGFMLRMWQSLWHLTGISPPLLQIYLPNFKGIQTPSFNFLRLGGLVFYAEMSCHVLIDLQNVGARFTAESVIKCLQTCQCFVFIFIMTSTRKHFSSCTHTALKRIPVRLTHWGLQTNLVITGSSNGLAPIWRPSH